jgi:hypothetical protein
MKRYRLTPPSVTIERALKSPSLLGARLGELSSWASWFACVKAVFGEPVNLTRQITTPTGQAYTVSISKRTRPTPATDPLIPSGLPGYNTAV